ncbi:TNT domain-containing protein [Streptomyces sp. UNOC14_S4]|uniref:TNT domain-containing protein n=1 Tax=Streptomyces sp. UNOC14_S4 TaxID=2872340 RepID=UPI001E332D64|nr:TNT domain-containing protein [Streptomyces sp. UNOC14_S4]MCC3767704.1 TNT domain-containing protein [Streptomyces sp. UNOC14_S4]
MTSKARIAAAALGAVLAGTALTGTAHAQTPGPLPMTPDGTCANPFQNNWLLGAADLPAKAPLGPLLKNWTRTGKGAPAPEVFLKEWRTADGKDWKWPGNDGFEGKKEVALVKAGTRMDRFGQPTGTFLAPTDASYGARAIPPSNLRTYPGGVTCNYHVYTVKKQFGVYKGAIAPWFGQPGKGTQYKLDAAADATLPKDVNVKWLLDNKYLEESTATAKPAAKRSSLVRSTTARPDVDRHSVRAELRKAGIPDDFYRIGDVHDPAAPASEYYSLHRAASGDWEVALTERGRKRVVATYASEDEACGRLYGELLDAARY